eukprot:CAMPEP_0167756452 /NCGR_PEP_ID=MMETSP0110_2-20121227/9394_1 /TAXON_ID=629695 /ORGANISM="Gymnochlora sp., Strain CCMP2014" /LENGTH=67 /DNA_ID=CAMNT_0007642565 /DNA_START=87 /DNA_END=290 /DNA_ORIENTATION=+
MAKLYYVFVLRRTCDIGLLENGEETLNIEEVGNFGAASLHGAETLTEKRSCWTRSKFGELLHVVPSL